MVDVTLPPPSNPSPWRPRVIRIKAIILRKGVIGAALGALFVAYGLSEALIDYAQRRCNSPIGRLAVRLKLDVYYSNCKCMTPSLDFSDACNSMYIPVVTELDQASRNTHSRFRPYAFPIRWEDAKAGREKSDARKVVVMA